LLIATGGFCHAAKSSTQVRASLLCGLLEILTMYLVGRAPF